MHPQVYQSIAKVLMAGLGVWMPTQTDAQAIGAPQWQALLQECGAGDLAVQRYVYFGPSNVVGPGSVWRRAEGGIRLRSSVSDLSERQADLSKIIVKGNDTACATGKSVDVGMATGASVSSRLVPINADISGALDKARDARMSITGWRVDQLAEGPFEKLVLSRPKTQAYRQDALTKERLIVTRAIWISGLTLTLKFSAADLAEARAKFKASFLGGGAIQAGMSARSDSSETITIKSAGGFYVLGELSQFTTNGFGIEGAEFNLEKVDLAPDIKLSKD